MSVGPLAVEIICVFCIAAFLLHKYGNWRKQHALVTLATLVSWYFSFIIISVLPLDVSSTYYRHCSENDKPHTNSSSPMTNISDGNTTSTAVPPPLTFRKLHVCQEPWSKVPDSVLPNLWHVVYWTSQVLTWIILPIMQSYANAGDFTISGKIKSALIANAIYYFSYLIIFIALIIYVAAKPGLGLDGQSLKTICITASNTWGLTLLVLLLGYGLVEVPRSCWNSSKKGYMLTYTQFKITKLSTEKAEAEEALEDLLEDIKRAAESIRHLHPLRKHVDTILEKCPPYVRNSVQNKELHEGDSSGPLATETPTEKSLIRLHQQVIQAIQNQHRTECQWNMLMEKAFDLEDIARNDLSSEHIFTPSYSPERPEWWRKMYSPSLEWHWKCFLRPWVLRILAVVLAVFTIMVVWCEITFFNKKPVLSLFAIFVQLAAKNYQYFHIELASMIIIAYLSVCAYYTVFKVRVLNYYYLAPYHQTDENSLLFSGTLLCRLTPPLCLNFLGLIHLDSHIIKGDIVETAYTQIMGHMDVISIISDGFNIYFPIGIILLCIATYFNLGSRLLHLLGFQQFIGDDDMTGDLVEEGKELIKREKRKRQRIEEGENRRRQYNERFTGNIRSSRYKTEKETAAKTLTRSGSNDSRSELLKEIEPVDYTGENVDSASDLNNQDLSINRKGSERGYHSQGTTNWSSKRSSIPPRGIFDDV